MTAREVTPGPFTLLEMDAAPVGGWWPEDVGEPVVRTEGHGPQKAYTAAVMDALLGAGIEKQRGDRYRARALALASSLRDVRFWYRVHENTLRALRERAEKVEQEVERLRTENRILHEQLAAPYDPWVHQPLTPEDEAVFRRPIPGTQAQPAPLSTPISRPVLPVALELIHVSMHSALHVMNALDELGMSPDDIRAALVSRAEAGVKKYGTPLMSHNGRDAREDLRQELLDALMYAAQMEMEAAK